MNYDKLNDQQIKNLLTHTQKASKPTLNLLRDTFFKDLKSGKTNKVYIDNVFHALMTEDIKLTDFCKWCSQISLFQNNTIYLYEPTSLISLFSYKEKIPQKLLKKVKPIYDICIENLNGIELIDISLEKGKQILFSFVMPSETTIKTESTKLSHQTIKSMYFGYLWIDFTNNSVVISLPPTNNIISVNYHTISRTEPEKVANMLLDFFNKNIHTLEFQKQDWVLDTLKFITEDYFAHNNPLITKQVKNFKTNEANYLIDFLSEKYTIINQEVSKERFKKAITEAFENELLNLYKPKPKDRPFKIFLQEVDKGLTQFKADNRSVAFTTGESRQIIIKMIENGTITSLGFSYQYEKQKTLQYKVFSGQNFFGLKRLNMGFTRKEIVNDVLSEFNEYKQRAQSQNTQSKSRISK